MEDSFSYFKDKWDKSHATPDFKDLHGENVAELELSEDFSNKHPKFPFSKKVREYLVRNGDPSCEEEWAAEKNVPDTKTPGRISRQSSAIDFTSHR
ncbi:hypothetical protein O181_056991, partial [Austropuccinia psidii MF-1]|nr:hypothetical protein [Austropuccinia psidii MF-1]